MKHPKISIFIGVTGAPEAADDGRLQKKADQVYDMYANNPKYKDMMQLYLGKPLLVVYGRYAVAVAERNPGVERRPFHGTLDDRVRLGTAVAAHRRPGQQIRLLGMGRPRRADLSDLRRETRDDGRLRCDPQAGRSGDAGYIPEKGRRDGQTLREQFARAREIGTRFAMVVSWNEWTTGEQPSVEVSKDIEPSVEHGDKYLKILKEEIRRFKSDVNGVWQRELELLNQNRRTDERKILELSGSVLLSRFYGGLLAGRGSDAGSGRIRERYGRR